MVNLSSLFKNFFDNPKISDDNLKKFTQDHLRRLKTNKPAPPPSLVATPLSMFDDIISATEAAYSAYFGSITTEDTDTVQRKVNTLTTDELMNQFIEMVRRYEGLVRSKYGVGTGKYMEFFPSGIQEYSSATKKNVETLMSRFSAAMTRNMTDMGSDVSGLFSQLFTDYTNARETQLDQKGKVSNDKAITSGKRSQLEIQLCQNVYFIAFTFPTDAEKCMAFFDQSIIRQHINSANDGIGRAVGTITGNGMPVVGATIKYVGLNLPVVHSKADGTYKARNVAIGMHQVEVSAPGFQTFTGNVNVVDDGDTELNVTLTAMPGA